MTYQLVIDDYIGRWGYSQQYVRSVLASMKGRPVAVKISSLGGDLAHGLDIRQQFKDHGDVTVYLSGFVASAATVIAMGAKRIVMSKYAMFLVHKCSNFLDVWGSYNADQMQSLIDDLTENKKENDKIDVVLANMYAGKCGKKVSDILDILKAGRWLTAQEAYDYGFVDEISDIDAGTKLNFSADLLTKFNAFGLSTLGLESNFATAPESVDNQTPLKTNQTMPSMKFDEIATLLDLEPITPDNDGYVSLTAEQFSTINDKLASYAAEAAAQASAISEKDAEIAALKEQVENLKKSPGDSTDEIEDDGSDSSFTANELFNSIKSAL